MDNSNARLAVAGGLSMICATCKRWAEGKERGLDKCTATTQCGSPIVGDTFHEYEGPITDFLRFCFVCGDQAQKGVRVRGHQRIIGVCNTHVEFVQRMAPKEPVRLPVIAPAPASILLPTGGEKTLEQLLGKPKKLLSQALMEMERGTFKPDG